MKKKIIKGCVIVLAGIIIYQTISIYKIKKELNEFNFNNSTNISGIYSHINDISSNVKKTLDEEMEKTNLTSDVEFKFNSLENQKYILDVRVELRRLYGDSKVMFMYKEKDGNDWSELELQANKQLSYMGKIGITSDKEYEYKVVTKGSLSESGEIKPIDKYDFMPKPPRINFGGNYDPKEYIIMAKLDNFDKNINMKISSIDVIANVEDREKIYNLKYSEEYSKVDGKFSNIGEYKIYIPQEEFKGNLNYIKIKVNYENGLVDLKDITEDFNIEYTNWN